jgi:hypothetical protein
MSAITAERPDTADEAPEGTETPRRPTHAAEEADQVAAGHYG